MDSLLLIGEESSNLKSFLERLGYSVVIESTNSSSLVSVISKDLVDLTIVDANEDLGSSSELISFLANNPYTETSPILVLGDEDRIASGVNLSDANIEFIDSSKSLGVIAGKIALLLRLRKLNGDNPDAHIAEINASLRDYQERVTKDLQDAKEIQINTLPNKIPSSNLFDIAYSYQPLEELGGDWYYIQEEESGEISFIIADVTGHGLAAAFIGGWIKLALRSCKESSPEIRLSEINKVLTPQLPEGRFITMTCALYNPKTGLLTHARAGHTPSLVHNHEEKTVTEILGEGFAIGFFDEATYTLEKVTLNIGDSFTLVTDGILEAQDRDNNFYGLENVVNSLNKTSIEFSSNMIQNMILNDFKDFVNDRILKDDVTTIVLKRLG